MCFQTVSETTAFAVYPSRWLMQLAKNMTQDNSLASGAYAMYSYAASSALLFPSCNFTWFSSCPPRCSSCCQLNAKPVALLTMSLLLIFANKWSKFGTKRKTLNVEEACDFHHRTKYSDFSRASVCGDRPVEHLEDSLGQWFPKCGPQTF